MSGSIEVTIAGRALVYPDLGEDLSAFLANDGVIRGLSSAVSAANGRPTITWVDFYGPESDAEGIVYCVFLDRRGRHEIKGAARLL